MVVMLQNPLVLLAAFESYVRVMIHQLNCWCNIVVIEHKQLFHFSTDLPFTEQVLHAPKEIVNYKPD